MSESLDDDHSHSLSLDIPSTTPSSANSSEPSCTHSQSASESTPTDTAATTATSPASSSFMTASTSSLPSLTVKFAPLPEMAPRKRRSGVPLGMAARVQLIRRRNIQQYEATPPHSYANSGTIWTDEELIEHRRRQEAIAMLHAHRQASMAAAAARQCELEGDEDEDEARHSGDEPGGSSYGRGGQGRRYRHAGKRSEDDNNNPDPILALGRIVKGAGKTLWKRVASKDLTVVRAKHRENEDTRERRGDSDEENKRASGSDVPLRPILATITSNVNEPPETKEEGRIFEEEIGDAFPLNVSQTETIVEGRAMYPRFPTPEPPISPAKATCPPTLTKLPKSPPLENKSVNGKS